MHKENTFKKGRNIMKKIPMIIMFITPYVVAFMLFSENATSLSIGASLILFVTVSLLNMVYAFKAVQYSCFFSRIFYMYAFTYFDSSVNIRFNLI